MIRILFCIFIAFVLSLTLVNPSFSADILWRLTHDDHYTLVLGQVLKKEKNILRVKVAHVVSGQDTDASIKVIIREHDLESVGQILEGDKIILSLDKSNSLYSIKWGIFTVSSLDYKTLKIIAPSTPSGDIAAFQWYINSNGEDNDFFGKEGKVYLRKSDNSVKQIYPLPIKEPRHVEELNQSTKPIAQKELPNMTRFATYGGISLIFLWLILYIYKKGDH